MARCRTKPVELEAVYVGGGDEPDWWEDAFRTRVLSGRPKGMTPKYFILDCGSGNARRVNFGDWIVKDGDNLIKLTAAQFGKTYELLP